MPPTARSLAHCPGCKRRVSETSRHLKDEDTGQLFHIKCFKKVHGNPAKFMKVRGKANQAQLAAQAAQMAVKYGPQAIEMAKKHGPAMIAAVTKAAEEYKAKKGKANKGDELWPGFWEEDMPEMGRMIFGKAYDREPRMFKKKKKAEKSAKELEKAGCTVTIYPVGKEWALRVDAPRRVGSHVVANAQANQMEMLAELGKAGHAVYEKTGVPMGLMDVPDAIAKARARKAEKQNPGYGWVVANDRGEQVAGPFEDEQTGWNYIKEKGLNPDEYSVEPVEGMYGPGTENPEQELIETGRPKRKALKVCPILSVGTIAETRKFGDDPSDIHNMLECIMGNCEFWDNGAKQCGVPRVAVKNPADPEELRDILTGIGELVQQSEKFSEGSSERKMLRRLAETKRAEYVRKRANPEPKDPMEIEAMHMASLGMTKEHAQMALGKKPRGKKSKRSKKGRANQPPAQDPEATPAAERRQSAPPPPTPEQVAEDARAREIMGQITATGYHPTPEEMELLMRTRSRAQRRLGQPHGPYHLAYTVIKPEVVKRLRDFIVKDRPWRGTAEEKQVKFDALLHDLSEIYAIPQPTLHISDPEHAMGSGFFNGTSNHIELPHYSVVTTLHEFKHALQHHLHQPQNEEVARGWSLSLFYHAAPKHFKTAVERGIVFFIEQEDTTRPEPLLFAFAEAPNVPISVLAALKARLEEMSYKVDVRDGTAKLTPDGQLVAAKLLYTNAPEFVVRRAIQFHLQMARDTFRGEVEEGQRRIVANPLTNQPDRRDEWIEYETDENPRGGKALIRGRFEIRPGGKYVRERVEDPDQFDRRSFRTIKRGKRGHAVVIGCPTGQWDPKTKRCRVGTRAQSVLHPLSEMERYGFSAEQAIEEGFFVPPQEVVPVLENPDPYYYAAENPVDAAKLAEAGAEIGGMAMTGATIGSAVPVVGTAVGAAVGASIGAGKQAYEHRAEIKEAGEKLVKKIKREENPDLMDATRELLYDE